MESNLNVLDRWRQTNPAQTIIIRSIEDTVLVNCQAIDTIKSTKILTSLVRRTPDQSGRATIADVDAVVRANGDRTVGTPILLPITAEIQASATWSALLDIMVIVFVSTCHIDVALRIYGNITWGIVRPAITVTNQSASRRSSAVPHTIVVCVCIGDENVTLPPRPSHGVSSTRCRNHSKQTARGRSKCIA